MTGAQLELLPAACPAPTGTGDQWETPPALIEAANRVVNSLPGRCPR